MARNRIILLILLLLSIQLAGQNSPGDQNAETILAKMAETYRKCKRYSDSGMVQTTFISSDKRQRIDRKPFKTVFIRPDRFRFQFRSKIVTGQLQRENIYIIFKAHDLIRSWWDLNPIVKTENSLSMAIAGATGVSGGASHTIPALLMPNHITGRRLTDLQDPIRIDDEYFRNQDCFCIHGYMKDTEMIIWISKRSNLVLKIEELHNFSDFKTEKVTTYYPSIHRKIAKKSLAFNPPVPVQQSKNILK